MLHGRVTDSDLAFLINLGEEIKLLSQLVHSFEGGKKIFLVEN